jgi:hypothetical protein
MSDVILFSKHPFIKSARGMGLYSYLAVQTDYYEKGSLKLRFTE